MTKIAILGFAIALACVPLSACNQERGAGHRERQGSQGTEQGNQATQPNQGTEQGNQSAQQAGAPEESRRRGHGLRRACGDELAKYCSGQDRGRQRRDCLQSHMDQLSADCKAALEERGARRRRRDF